MKFIAFIRPETRFDGMDALKRRISEDIKKAKELLANYRCKPRFRFSDKRHKRRETCPRITKTRFFCRQPIFP